MFDFDHLLDLAQILFDKKDKLSVNCDIQVIYRTIINRAYYAAFNHVKTCLSLNNFKTREFDEQKGRMVNKNNESEHILLIEELKNRAKNPENRKYKNQLYTSSSRLKNLFDSRIDADYKETIIFNEMDVTDSIEKSKSIINFLDFSIKIK